MAKNTENFDLTKLTSNEMVNVFKHLTNEMEDEHRSASQIYKILRLKKANTMEIVQAELDKGRKINMDILHDILNVGNFKLFSMFLTTKMVKDKETSKELGYDVFNFVPLKDKKRFTVGQGYRTLFKACRLHNEQAMLIQK